jgi:hypothetical protein
MSILNPVWSGVFMKAGILALAGALPFAVWWYLIVGEEREHIRHARRHAGAMFERSHGYRAPKAITSESRMLLDFYEEHKSSILRKNPALDFLVRRGRTWLLLLGVVLLALGIWLRITGGTRAV